MRRAACCALLAVVAVTACGQSEREARTAPPDGIVARVGSVAIGWADLQSYMEEIERSFEAQDRDFPAEGTSEHDNLLAQALEKLVSDSQVEQAAAELGVSAPQELVEREVADIEPGALEEYGVSAERARAAISADLLEHEIFKAVVSSVEVTDGDVRAAYERDIERYTRRAPREALYLWVRDEALAWQLRDRIAAGEDFEALADEYEDPEIDSGRQTFDDEGSAEGYVAAVFSLDVGELSNPIKAGVGWALVEPVSPLDPGRVIPLDEAGDSIRFELTTQKNREAMTAWQRDLEVRLAPVYADGFAPAELRTEIPFEEPPGEQKDVGACDLPDGAYTYEQLAELGCAGGFPIPGVDGPACPEQLPGSQFTSGFDSEEVDSGWADYLTGPDSPSCAPDPRGSTIEIGTRLRPALSSPGG